MPSAETKDLSTPSRYARLAYLDGLRGWAAFAVFFGHLIKRFGFQYDDLPKEGLVGKLLYKTPFDFLINGSYSVRIFFIISGFSLSYYYFVNHSREKLMEMAFLRIFRLGVPMVCSAVIIDGCLRMGWYHTRIIEPDFWSAVVGTVTEYLLGIKQGYSSYNSVFWTMTYEYYASMAIFFMLMLAGNLSFRKRALIYLVLGGVLRDSIYLGFLFGVLLCDLTVSFEIQEKLKRKISCQAFCRIEFVVFLLYLSIFTVLKQFPRFWSILAYLIGENLLEYIMLSFLVVMATLNGKYSRFLSNALSGMLGKLSLSLYFVHLPVIYTFSMWLHGSIAPWFEDPIMAAMITIGVTIPVAFFFSYLFWALIEARLVRSVLSSLRQGFGWLSDRFRPYALFATKRTLS
ncbi:MAG: acyltransferase [Magnetococcales bacterium]|nr:acyltransferase [Magnetococcales bacterium]